MERKEFGERRWLPQSKKLNRYLANYQTTVRLKTFNITCTSLKKSATDSTLPIPSVQFPRAKLNVNWTNGLRSSVVPHRSRGRRSDCQLYSPGFSSYAGAIVRKIINSTRSLKASLSLAESCPSLTTRIFEKSLPTAIGLFIALTMRR